MTYCCSKVGWEDCARELEAWEVEAVVLGIFEFCLGLLSYRLCAAVNPSGGKPLNNFFQPLQNTRNPTSEDNDNLYKQIAVVKNKRIEKIWKGLGLLMSA